MMAMSAAAALWFLPFCAPIALWIAWSDLKFMRIPNLAAAALCLVFLCLGPIVLSISDWLWRILHLPVVLAAGVALHLLRQVGAGDAKCAAAMAPFFDAQDAARAMPWFAAVLLGAFAAHRLLRRLPALRRATPDWQSWNRPDFPMGFALAGALVFYLLAVGFQGH